MQSLRELQFAFGAALLGDADTWPQQVALGDGIPAAERFAVYRNNCFASLGDALAAVYPVVERLVGEPFFRQLARGYVRAYPPASGNVHDFGDRLAAFIAAEPALAPYPYMADVARLEWAWHRVYHAPDCDARIDTVRLAGISDAQWQALRFELHPATALVDSPYPILRIWALNQDGADSDAEVRLDEGGDSILVARAALDVELRPVSAGEHALLQTFADDGDLAAAYAAAERVEPGFDLAAALCRFIEQRVLVDARLPSSPSRRR